MKKIYTIIENQQVFELLQKLVLELHAKNPKACSNTNWLTGHLFDTHNVLGFYPKDGGFFFCQSVGKNLNTLISQGALEIPLAEMISFIQTFSGMTVIPVSKDYNAEVSAEDVKVGCQTITFDTIEKIYQTMVEYRKK